MWDKGTIMKTLTPKQSELLTQFTQGILMLEEALVSLKTAGMTQEDASMILGKADRRVEMGVTSALVMR